MSVSDATNIEEVNTDGIIRVDYKTVNDDILDTLKPPTVTWYLGVSVAICFLLVGAYCWIYQIRNGLGVGGITHPVMWGVYITDFVFWVGIAHSGTLISAVLFLFRATWRLSLIHI